MGGRARWLILALSIAGCEPLSSEVDGRDDSVRYTLPEGAIDLLENGERFEVLALGDRLAESYGPDGTPRPPPAGTLGGFPVLATVPVTDPAQRRAIYAALYASLRAATGSMLCFEPHHAIRAVRGDRHIEIAICFGCWNLEIVGLDHDIAFTDTGLRAAIDPEIERGAQMVFAVPDVPDESESPFAQGLERWMPADVAHSPRHL